MKHIKTFEQLNLKILELEEFSKSNLIYLMDEEFVVLLYESSNDGFLIQLKKQDDTETWFSWQQISDYYISFVNRLLNEYKDYKFNTAEVHAIWLYQSRFSVPKQVTKIIKLDEILNNTIDPDLQIASITLNIVKK